jgi:hypothetical protein
MASKSKYYNTGGGELKFIPIVDGVLGTIEDFGQTENISFSTTVETLTHDNTETCTAFEDMNILKKVTGKLSIETLEISPTMLARAFLGAKSEVAIPSGTNVTSNVTVTALDSTLDIGVKFLNNVVVKDDTDSTTYDLGVDYTINNKKGTIKVIDGGAISLNDTLHLTYDNDAYGDITIEGFIHSKLEGVLIFESCAGNGLDYKYTFHRVSLLVNGDYSLKNATEFNKLSFEGTMLASELVNGDGVSKLLKIESSEKA